MALGGVRCQDVEPAGVADDREAVAGRQRLIGEQPRGVEQLAEGVRAHHAGLSEQGIDGGGGRGRGRGVRGAGTLPGDGAAALHGQYRLAPRQRPHRAGELARVAERLQVQRHRPGRRVVVPVRDQVVAADVGLVAERDEGGDPASGPGRAVEQGDADRAGL